jgi:hypothetical protein
VFFLAVFGFHKIFNFVPKIASETYLLKQTGPPSQIRAGPGYFSSRAVGGSENLGVPVLFGGHNLPPLVEIGLTDLPKFGGAMASPAPPGTTGLNSTAKISNSNFFSMYLN